MKLTSTTLRILSMLLLFIIVAGTTIVSGQETNPNSNSGNSYHNQLFFNRFLINPTFSLVRENKSYLNILHRNQYAAFEDNSQNYFLGYSGKLSENTAMGIGVYSQWSGVIQQFGFNANYATGVRLGSNSRLTFGTNITYFNEGIDKNRAIAVENDLALAEARKESKLSIQPGITLSLGNFDFGVYTQDLFQYNQTSNEFSTNLNDTSVKASLQYTHSFLANRGLFENARLMPLVQFGKNQDGSFDYMGSLLLDLPNYGWLQTTFDDRYGMAMGVGFNLSKKMSLGYLMEKDISVEDVDLGWNHEVSLAYTFNNATSNQGIFADTSQDQKIDGIIRNYEEQIMTLVAEKEQRETKDAIQEREEIVTKSISEEITNEESSSLAYQNRLILDELVLRQDSIENARNKAFERKFEMIVRAVRNEVKNSFKAQENSISRPQNTILVNTEDIAEPESPIHTLEHKDYLKLPIKVLGQSDIIGVKSGYYVIANVYKTKKYLKAFMNELKEQGLNAKQFYNKENGLYYVYLADFNFREDAENAYVSNLNGKYNDEKWIMQVDNHDAIVNNTYVD